MRRKSQFTDGIKRTLREIEYRSGKVIQQWRGSRGNVRLSHLLVSFLLNFNRSFTLFFTQESQPCVIPRHLSNFESKSVKGSVRHSQKNIQMNNKLFMYRCLAPRLFIV